MSRQIKNPFYIVLGVIGFTFTITAASYCLSVLRGIRPKQLSPKNHTLSKRLWTVTEQAFSQGN